MGEETDVSSVVLLSDPKRGTRARASSILQSNSKRYGPMNALDLQNASSCWNSEGCGAGGSSSGSYSEQRRPSWIQLDFGRPVLPSQLRIQFQAGFGAEVCTVQAQDVGATGVNNHPSHWVSWDNLELEDAHELQIRSLHSSSTTTSSIRLVFDECADFYGRLTIYQLEVWGTEASNSDR